MVSGAQTVNHFSGMDQAATTELCQAGSIVELEANQVIGGTTSVFMVISGRVVLFSPQVKANVLVTQAGQGGHVLQGTKEEWRSSGTSRVLILDDIALSGLSTSARVTLDNALYRYTLEATARATVKANVYSRKIAYLQSYIPRFHMEEEKKAVHSDLVQELLKEIPQLPLYLSELLVLLESDDAPAQKVVEVAQNDASLVTEIMRRVNSSEHGLSKRVDDFKMAVVLLGFEEVYRIAFAASMEKMMPNAPALRDIQDHAIAVSRMAFDLAKTCNNRKASRISVVGLLHDVGRIVMHLLESSHSEMKGLINLIDSAELGAHLLKKWDFPESIWKAVEMQNYPAFSIPEELPEECRETVAFLFLTHLCDDFLGSEEVNLPDGFAPEYLRLINIKKRNIRDLTTQVIMPAMRKQKFTFVAPLLDDDKSKA